MLPRTPLNFKKWDGQGFSTAIVAALAVQTVSLLLARGALRRI